MSLAIPTTLNCQVDGLVKIHVPEDKNDLCAHFEFENNEKLAQATGKVARACSFMNYLNVLQCQSSIPKTPAVGYFAKLNGTVGAPVKTTEELINRIAMEMFSETPSKAVPIVLLEKI